MLVGRKKEIAELERLYNRNRSDFVAISGRRRIGKTYLVKQMFKNNFVFYHTGLYPQNFSSAKKQMEVQLLSFYISLINQGLEGYSQPKSWLEAFFQLTQLLKKLDKGERMVIFIDEIPWMDTPRSCFLSGLESFWNGWCYCRDNIMLVVCGSDMSWMYDRLFNNTGGLYGRLTRFLELSPFTLKDCEEYFATENIELSKDDIMQSYTIFGGIPYYLSFFRNGYSFEQNVDRIFFGRDSFLKDEFDRLFDAVFTKPDECKKIIRFLSTNSNGYSKEQIVSATGCLDQTLNQLENSGFITSGEYYKLIDNFCLFWLKFVEKNKDVSR